MESNTINQQVYFSWNNDATDFSECLGKFRDNTETNIEPNRNVENAQTRNFKFAIFKSVVGLETLHRFKQQQNTKKTETFEKKCLHKIVNFLPVTQKKCIWHYCCRLC